MFDLTKSLEVTFTITSVDIAAGIVGNCEKCPAARAISREIQTLDFSDRYQGSADVKFTLTVSETVDLSLWTNGYSVYQVYRAEMPPKLNEFVRQFDIGHTGEPLLDLVHSPFTLTFTYQP